MVFISRWILLSCQGNLGVQTFHYSYDHGVSGKFEQLDKTPPLLADEGV